MDAGTKNAKQIFDQAAELSPAERDEFLERSCAGDAALRAEIDALLGALDAAARRGFLATPTGSAHGAGDSVSVWEAPLREGPGTQIGPYKLLQAIGEGGFGTVFLAEQEAPLRRRVALKIIKLGMDTRRVIARFEAERQALAMMDHPNIAKVFDAGATDTGRPYFVMELVRGIAITEYCDRENLPVAQRLELFQQVCHAVQHAHHKGIIHRDIKPSNVLVTVTDAKPVPKVIDFGIAKATAGRLTEKTLFTEHRQLIGTPEYMSPEQADTTASDIDTRSDVYSLGVLLYELLTGALPFDSERLRSAAFAEIQRIIREEEPRKPSTRLSTLEGLPNVAARRNTEPARLSRLVRGELDWIVMKCLEKDRTRRYETASGLALDVQRHLSGEPVLAAPASASYRLRKFVRRNRAPVIVGAVLASALVLGIAGTTIGLYKARRAAAAALAAKAEAEARRAEIKQVADFQARMLGQVNATDAGVRLMEDLRRRLDEALVKEGVPASERATRVQALGDGLRSVNATDAAAAMIDRTILRPAVEAIERDFKNQPVVDAALRQTLAELYRRLGRYEDALVLHERALQTRRRVLGAEHPDTLRSIAEAGILLEAQGKAAEAEPYYREAIEKRRRILGDEHRDTLTSMNNMGHLLQALGRLADAEPYYREALEKRRRLLGPSDEDTLVSVSNLGYLLEAQGKAAEAEPYYREALEGSRRVLGDDHPDTLTSINNMGYLLHELGRASEAEPYYREALERRRRVLGESHPETISAISNMAALHRAQGRPAEAERCFREALEKSRAVLGIDHETTLIALSNLGTVLYAQGRIAEAEPHHREALERTRKAFGEDHPNTLREMGTMAVVLEELGRFAEAEAMHRDALDRMRRTLGEEHPYTLISMGNLGDLLSGQKRYAEAEPLLRETLEKARRVHGDDHPTTVAMLGNLAACLRAQARPAEAEPLLRERLARMRARLGDDRWETANARAALGTVLAALGRYTEAEELVLGAEPILSTAEGVPPGRHAQCVQVLAELYEKWHTAEPGKGYDAKAAEWKARRDTLTQPSPPAR